MDFIWVDCYVVLALDDFSEFWKCKRFVIDIRVVRFEVKAIFLYIIFED